MEGGVRKNGVLEHWSKEDWSNGAMEYWGIGA
jgi:hypothetical protein